MAKILLLLAQTGFQAKEYSDTRHVLAHAGHMVMTASRDGGIARSTADEGVITDVALADVHATDFDGVFVIGGPGCLSNLDNEETVRIMREAKESETMLYGAICVAPRILAKAGLLRGVRITGWDNDGKLGTICENGGCIQTAQSVTRDGRVITANGPMAATDWGETIVTALAGRPE